MFPLSPNSLDSLKHLFVCCSRSLDVALVLSQPSHPLERLYPYLRLPVSPPPALVPAT